MCPFRMHHRMSLTCTWPCCLRGSVKELHFFDSPHRFGEGAGFFRARFPGWVNSKGAGKRILDCTPTYLGNMPSVQRIAQTFAGTNKLKIVVMLR